MLWGILLLWKHRKKVTAPKRHSLNRKLVIWCILNGRPWAAISDIGIKFVGCELSAEYASTTPAHGTLSSILTEMLDTAKGIVNKAHRKKYLDLETIGYKGGGIAAYNWI